MAEGKKKTQIVIVGGGAGGLELARRLGAKYGRKAHDIILIDRNRTHIWKPLLHEVAAGSLDASLDEVGYRSHCHRWGYRYFYGNVVGIDRNERRVHIAPVQDARGRTVVGSHAVRYDYLVLAYGSVTNDFGIPGVSDNCLFLDSRVQADEFRDLLLDHCLRVSREVSMDASSRALVRIAIVGAGATGVELSAELYNAADKLSHYGLEVFDRHRLDVTLVEAGPRVLPALSERLSVATHRELERLGVKVRTGVAVVAADSRGLTTKDGELVQSDLMVWAAGVKAAPIANGLDGLTVSRNGQIIVTPSLQSIDDVRIFAMGDCASCTLPGEERPVPPRAQAAHQMATSVFDNLNRMMDHRDVKAFVYRDYGSLVSLSRFAAVGSLMGRLVGGRLAVEGRLARFFYLSLYRVHLLGVHGLSYGSILIFVSTINRVVRPRLKFH